MLIASFSTMIITIGHLNQQLTSRQLDLLRLTHRGEWDVVMAHDALSQLRAWRIVPVEVALRIASVSIIFLNSNYDYYQSSFDKSLFIGNTIFNPLWWLVYIFILCISIAYMVEPVLRMRVIVAFSTVVALKLKHLPMALIAGTGAIMMVYLIQAVLIALTIWMGYLILINGETIFTFICVFLPLLFLMIGVLFVVYVRLRKSALTFSLNHVFDDRR